MVSQDVYAERRLPKNKLVGLSKLI